MVAPGFPPAPNGTAPPTIPSQIMTSYFADIVLIALAESELRNMSKATFDETLGASRAEPSRAFRLVYEFPSRQLQNVENLKTKKNSSKRLSTTMHYD